MIIWQYDNMIISESMQISDTPSFDVPFQHIAARSWVLWRQGKKMYHFSSSWKTQDNFIEIEVLPVAWQQFQVNIFIRVQSAQSAGLFQDLPGSQGKWKGHVSNVSGTLQVGGLSKRQLAEIRQLLRSGRPGSMSGSFFLVIGTAVHVLSHVSCPGRCSEFGPMNTFTLRTLISSPCNDSLSI